MKKHINWYLDGWRRRTEYDVSGKKHTVWDYQGAYYSYHLEAAALSRLKWRRIATGVFLLLLWIVLSLSPAKGKDYAFYVGGPWFLAILPLMELLLGMIGTGRTRAQMTYRDFYAGYKRLQYGSYILFPLLFVAVVSDIVFAIVYRQYISTLWEILWIIGAAICMLTDGVLIVSLCRNVPQMMPPVEGNR